MQKAVVPRDFPLVIEQLIWRPGQLKLRACTRCVAAEPDARRTPERTATTPAKVTKSAKCLLIARDDASHWRICPQALRGHSGTLAQPSVLHHAVVEDLVEVPVIDGGTTATWQLAVTQDDQRHVVLSLSDGFGRTWAATGGDAFDALMKLRLEAEPDGVQICCNGARRNAWSSGMQRDMAMGFSTYLLRLGEHNERPPSARTLEPAPAADVTTVAEQMAFHEQWLAELQS